MRGGERGERGEGGGDEVRFVRQTRSRARARATAESTTSTKPAATTSASTTHRSKRACLSPTLAPPPATDARDHHDRRAAASTTSSLIHTSPHLAYLTHALRHRSIVSLLDLSSLGASSHLLLPSPFLFDALQSRLQPAYLSKSSSSSASSSFLATTATPSTFNTAHAFCAARADRTDMRWFREHPACATPRPLHRSPAVHLTHHVFDDRERIEAMRACVDVSSLARSPAWLACGGKLGHVAMCQLPDLSSCTAASSSSSSSPTVNSLSVHSGIVSCVLPGASSSIFSCSYDGRVCHSHFGQSPMIDALFSSPTDSKLFCLAAFDPTSSSSSSSSSRPCHTQPTLLCGDELGHLHVIDSRTAQLSSYALHTKKLAWLDVCPTHPTLVCTAANVHARGEGPALAVWDLRCVRGARGGDSARGDTVPLPLSVHPYPRVIKHVSFSPSGNYLLTTCLDDTIRVHATDACWSLDVDAAVRTFAHSNSTGIWIADFRPDWHPTVCDAFTIGNLGNNNNTLSMYSVHRSGPVTHYQDAALRAVSPLCAYVSTGGTRAGTSLISSAYSRIVVWNDDTCGFRSSTIALSEEEEEDEDEEGERE